MKTRFQDLSLESYALPAAIVERTPTPALVVYVKHVRENLKRMLLLTGGPDRWRPHVKTTKIPAIWAEMARAGIRNFKCATTREASILLRTLREEGLEGADLLLAYPLIGPSLTRLGEIAAEHPEARVSVLCEDAGAVQGIHNLVSIFIDVNPGMNRTGVPAEDIESILAIARGAGPRFRGLHYYDGHIHDPDQRAHETRVHAGIDRLLEIEASCIDAGCAVGELITSGTHAFMAALTHPSLGPSSDRTHRVSPGTVVFHDLTTEQCNPTLDLVPAALVMSRIISQPGPRMITCDAGSKSVAAEAGHPCAFPIAAPECEARIPSEEHLPFDCSVDELRARGEVLYLVPRHVCPTVNLAGRALLVDGDEVRVVDVEAAGHELY
ncbi:MAG: D-serine deaminase-like pyridoxal phosphate-dependent protein [Planctomycetota bacterium]|jgi:D-serine deaminase-like pyridoxal phosphate-dependent protein